jgi:homoserine dehydrogenase
MVPDAFVAARRDDVDVVVELLGGDEPARSLIAAALEAGKPVVTANKHVLAHHGLELEAIARKSGAALRYEAAVCGGTPVLDTIARGLAANHCRRVRGIVNGSSRPRRPRAMPSAIPAQTWRATTRPTSWPC